MNSVPAVEEQQANRTYLVGAFTRETRESAEASLQEMEQLCLSAGLTVAGRELVRLRTPNPALYLGKGQTERVIETVRELEAPVIVFDQPLSPVQMRNWARRAQCEIYDRHGVILEIFSRRARTREAKLQVELARAEYALSHLAGMWQHLSRQGGGSRLARGEGEKQIEIDRRRLRERVTRARAALEKITLQRALRRDNREGTRKVALVGYTNAGKSSLLNALANARLRSADQLFATLDPVTRRLSSGPDTTLLLTDTVGFVRNLPPELINAFHSTLEEALEADLILLVLDGSDPEAPVHLETTRHILNQLGAGEIPVALVLNKLDRTADPGRAEFGLRSLMKDTDRVFRVSALTGEGIPQLRHELLEGAGNGAGAETGAGAEKKAPAPVDHSPPQ